MKKQELLLKFIELNKGLAKQGSDAWRLARKTRFGGSELNSILTKPQDVILDKLGLGNPFYGNIYTDAGSIYEEITRLYIEKKLGVPIHEFGSCPTSIYGVNISPDGICLTNDHDISQILTHPSGKIQKSDSTADPSLQPQSQSQSQSLVLIEIKNPYNRIPNGKVPKQYLPQIQGGLWGFEMLDYALFIDSVTRRCKVRDLYTNDNFIFNKHTDSEFQGPHSACGIIGIYDIFHKYSDSHINYTHIGDQKFKTSIDIGYPINIGTIDENLLRDIFKITNKLTVKEYLINSHFTTLTHEQIDLDLKSLIAKPQLYNDEKMFMFKYDLAYYMNPTNRDEVKQDLIKLKEYAISNNYKFIGYIPWKIMDINIIDVHKDDAFRRNIPLIESNARLLNKIISSEDKIKVFEDTFNQKIKYDYIDDSETETK